MLMRRKVILKIILSLENFVKLVKITLHLASFQCTKKYTCIEHHKKSHNKKDPEISQMIIHVDCDEGERAGSNLERV